MLSADACCCSSAVDVTVSVPWQQLMSRQVRSAPHATTRWLPHAAARLMVLPAGNTQEQFVYIDNTPENNQCAFPRLESTQSTHGTYGTHGAVQAQELQKRHATQDVCAWIDACWGGAVP
jgi:hypothetical protein